MTNTILGLITIVLLIILIGDYMMYKKLDEKIDDNKEYRVSSYSMFYPDVEISDKDLDKIADEIGDRLADKIADKVIEKLDKN